MSRRAETSIACFVDGDRLWSRLQRLSLFGATANGGVNRLALSPQEIEARAELVRWGREIGLRPYTDEAANLFLRLDGRQPDLPPVLTGSHIDSQPTGGKFDGAYGVMAALEAVEAIANSGLRPRSSIEVVAWMNEEGSRFAPGMMGSAVFAGRREMSVVEEVRDKGGVSVKEALVQVLGADHDVVKRPLGFPVARFLEAHIEQGVTLERRDIPIGIVTGIQGKKTFKIEVVGEESHAGTTPRAVRKDALVSAVEIVRALQDAIWDDADEVRFTIGMFTVTPNAPSVVPGRVAFSIDLRHDDRDTILRLGALIPTACRGAAGRCEVRVQELLYDEPIVFPESSRRLFSEAAERLGLAHMALPSPAGHDARYLHYVAPTGMVFIPCAGGISHNEAESITENDATAGARVLCEAVFASAQE
jgi:N-carbamoyl-L-amino-acid hydrolase